MPWRLMDEDKTDVYWNLALDEAIARVNVKSSEKINTLRFWRSQNAVVIGRFQCLPPHEGHLKLIRHVLNEGKNVCVGIRKEDSTDKNPYSFWERFKEFEKVFRKEILSGKVIVIPIPDIEEIVHGRNVGWGIREIRLDDKTEAISGTKIRKKQRQLKKKF